MKKKLPLILTISLFAISLFFGKKTLHFNTKENEANYVDAQESISSNMPASKNIFLDIEYILPDDYPITNKMIETTSKNIICKSICSLDKSWFVDSKKKQALVINLETDYHRFRITHFKIGNSLKFALDNIDFYKKNSKNPILIDRVNSKIRKKDLSCFLDKAEVIPQNYFTTNNGLYLGLSSELVRKSLGNPHNTVPFEGGYIMKWSYPGSYLQKNDGKKYAKNSFGYSINIQIINEKINAIIIQNEIP